MSIEDIKSGLKYLAKLHSFFWEDLLLEEAKAHLWPRGGYRAMEQSDIDLSKFCAIYASFLSKIKDGMTYNDPSIISFASDLIKKMPFISIFIFIFI